MTGEADKVAPLDDAEAKDAAAFTMPIGEAFFTQRSIRKFRPDPIPVEHLRLIAAATFKAPSGGNSQPGRLLLVNDRDKITAFGNLYHDSWWKKRKDDHGWSGPSDVGEVDGSTRAALQLADEMKDAPAVAFILSRGPYAPESVLMGAQNLMLAARALGVGSVPTRLHNDDVATFRQLFGVPAEIQVYFCIPLGYPRGRFGPTSRLPLTETTSWNTWGTAAP